MDMERSHRTNVSNLIVGGAAATAGIFYLVSKLRKGQIRTHTIPPIIARSVSDAFEFESDTEFVSRSSAISPPTGPLTRPHKYIRSDFEPAKGIEVQFYSSEFTKVPFIWSSTLAKGAWVEIWLQRLPRGSGVWEGLDEPGPHVVIRADRTDFEVELDKELQQNGGNVNPKRPIKRKYKGNGNAAYRFGKILIYKGTSPTVVHKRYESNPTDEHDFGDQYSIAFHNEG